MDMIEHRERLCTCFKKQIEIYADLEQITRSISGKISLTGGDFSSVLPVLQKKQDLVSSIDQLRHDYEDDMRFWMSDENTLTEGDKAPLREVLDSLEVKIERFLQQEKLLQKQIDFYCKAD